MISLLIAKVFVVLFFIAVAFLGFARQAVDPLAVALIFILSMVFVFLLAGCTVRFNHFGFIGEANEARQIIEGGPSATFSIVP